MTKEELLIIKLLLKEVLSNQSNSGCNDFFMPNTPDNLRIMKVLNEFDREQSFYVKDKEIIGMDMTLTQYILFIVDRELKAIS